jgi:Fe-S cluster biogenesis protein NfuA/nitrite reductase/ring-hydroxylating ferredoxin subunit
MAELNQIGKRVQELVGQVESWPDPAARALVRECLRSVLGFYEQGLTRVLEVVEEADTSNGKVFQSLIDDNVVSGLLLIHGLHPEDVETRLGKALDKVRPYLKSHGGNVELIRLENEKAILRLEGTCKSCPSSTVTMELAVRRAIEELCPDLAGFEVEGAGKGAETTKPLPNPEISPNAPSWTLIEDISQFQSGEAKAMVVAGLTLMVCRVNGNLYAYRNICPACGLPLVEGVMEKNHLGCKHGHQYDVLCAGRGLEDSNIHLTPLPLLLQGNTAKIFMR